MIGGLFCGGLVPSAVLAGWLALSLSAYAPALIEKSSANASAVSRAKDLGRLELADVPHAAAIEDGIALTADIAAAVAATPNPDPAPEAATAEMPAAVIKLASADPALILPAEAPPALQISPEPAPVLSEAAPAESAPAPEPVIKLASADPTEIVTTDALSPAAIATGPAPAASKPSPPADTVAVLDECFVMDACIDRYLWALYQRTAKEDLDQGRGPPRRHRQAQGQDGHGDAQLHKAGRSGFWLEGSESGRARQHADDGLRHRRHGQELQAKAVSHAARSRGRRPVAGHHQRVPRRLPPVDRERPEGRLRPLYHGGSTRGGYGHGMAADIVSTQGNNRAQRWVSTEILWKWVDANGKAFGIGRPYLGRDPPHVGPVDGQEYISKRGTGDRKEATNVRSKKVMRAAAHAKLRKAHAAARAEEFGQAAEVGATAGKRDLSLLRLPPRGSAAVPGASRRCPRLACAPAPQRWFRPQAVRPPASPCPWPDAPAIRPVRRSPVPEADRQPRRRKARQLAVGAQDRLHLPFCRVSERAAGRDDIDAAVPRQRRTGRAQALRVRDREARAAARARTGSAWSGWRPAAAGAAPRPECRRQHRRAAIADHGIAEIDQLRIPRQRPLDEVGDHSRRCPASRDSR